MLVTDCAKWRRWDVSEIGSQILIFNLKYMDHLKFHKFEYN
jgi:hypothetical protein